MANLRARQIVPRHFDWTDDDQYSDDGGVPCSAMLGRKLIRNDRALSAHCLRGFGNAWPRRNAHAVPIPQLAHVDGSVVGPFAYWVSDGAVDGEWYIRAALPVGETALVVPFSEVPANVQPLAGAVDDAAHTITGAGAVANYGPFDARLRSGGMVIGLAIYPQSDGAAFETGDVDDWIVDQREPMRNRETFRTDAAGAAKIDIWVGDSTEYQHVIRFLDANDYPLSMWYLIADVTKEINESDTVTLVGSIPDEIVLNEIAKGNLQWQSMYVAPMDLYSVMFREKPPVDEDYSEALSRG